jgi:hypothetical protein
MKPYKIGSKWVDLDQVLWAAEEVSFDTHNSPYVFGCLQLAFQNEPWQPAIGEVYRTFNSDHSRVTGFEESGLNEIKAKWAAFLETWKNKDAPQDSLQKP